MSLAWEPIQLQINEFEEHSDYVWTTMQWEDHYSDYLSKYMHMPHEVRWCYRPFWKSPWSSEWPLQNHSTIPWYCSSRNFPAVSDDEPPVFILPISYEQEDFSSRPRTGNGGEQFLHFLPTLFFYPLQGVWSWWYRETQILIIFIKVANISNQLSCCNLKPLSNIST